MKYTIETTKNGCVETLELGNGKIYKRESKIERWGMSCPIGSDFSDQLEKDGIEDDEILDKVYEALDESSIALDFTDLNFALSGGF